MANRLDLEKLKALIIDSEYVMLGRLMVCQLTIFNGHQDVGVAGVVDMANHDEALGKKIAYDKAVGAMAPIGSFMIRQNMYLRTLCAAQNATQHDGEFVQMVGHLTEEQQKEISEKYGLVSYRFPDISKE